VWQKNSQTETCYFVRGLMVLKEYIKTLNNSIDGIFYRRKRKHLDDGKMLIIS
jgi:hypothetical protein